jgi:hypothetical protein
MTYIPSFDERRYDTNNTDQSNGESVICLKGKCQNSSDDSDSFKTNNSNRPASRER